MSSRNSSIQKSHWKIALFVVLEMFDSYGFMCRYFQVWCDNQNKWKCSQQNCLSFNMSKFWCLVLNGTIKIVPVAESISINLNGPRSCSKWEVDHSFRPSYPYRLHKKFLAAQPRQSVASVSLFLRSFRADGQYHPCQI